MASCNNEINKNEITEGLYTVDLWAPFDSHIISYVKSPIHLYFISSKTAIIGRALRHAIVDFLDNILTKPNEYIENETTVIGTEHRLYHSRRYTINSSDNECQDSVLDDKIEFDISSLAPTVFYQLREDIGISNNDFRKSFSEHHLKDFTNPGKSGSLMYKTFDDLFILKTLREYEARLLMQILSGYHLQLTQRSTIFNRYVSLYSIRFPTLISTIEIYIVIMVNTFTPSLQINEIFDLKGSTMKRKLQGNLSKDKLYKLKDLDFIDLYPNGIRIPSNIYHRLHMVITNDVKVLKKLHITDFSLILGIKHLDISIDDLMQHRPTAGVSALFHMTHRLAFILPSHSSIDLTSLSIPYLKPLEMLKEKIDTNFYYNNDSIANLTLPIPGIINKSNQRVYLYLAIIDMLQTYDSIKYIERTLKKIWDYTRHQEYSVIEPDEYEKRIIKFLFENIFIDAGDDFPWNVDKINQPIVKINNESIENIHTDTFPHLTESKNSCLKDMIQFRL
jgi:hypothetical protein